MARKGGLRQFQKVMKRCPHCGSRRPKELVEGPRRFRFGLYLTVGIITCGLGLLLPFLFFEEALEAYCDECEESFSYS